MIIVASRGRPMATPPQLGFGSGITCWRRLDEWQRAGVWEALHALLLARLRAADAIDFSRVVVDSSQIQAKKGAPRQGRARSIAVGPAPSTTCSSMPAASRSPTILTGGNRNNITGAAAAARRDAAAARSR
jgi:hypothetical protein